MRPTAFRVEIPVDVPAGPAREAAERELSDPIYHQDDPTLVERAVDWLAQAFDAAAGVSPGGVWGLLVLLVLLVAAVVVIRLKVGPLASTASGDVALFDERPRTAAQYRAAADVAAAEGRWADAVRERLRAIVRELEERAVLEPRPGRTATEAATEAGRELPGVAAGLHEAAELFGAVAYGGRAATAATDQRMRAVDAEVAGARPVLDDGARSVVPG